MFAAIIAPLGAGLAMFLFGMKIMEMALDRLAGPRLAAALARFTRTPARGMAASAAVTAALQSSTAVTVATIGLVNAGLIRFRQTLGVILGANIGTCLTTTLLGGGLDRLAVPLLLTASAVCAASWLPLPLGARRAASATAPAPVRPHRPLALRYGALAAAGFACVLLAMQVLQSIAPALRERGTLDAFIALAQTSLLWGVLAGAALTALIHSSAACIAMAMSLAATQAISPTLGIAIVIGANIGTCATALIASASGSRYGRWVAWTHIALNAGGALLFYPLIGLLEQTAALLSATPAGQIAQAQTLFNVSCSLLALPICYLPSRRKPA
ncbi:Na/Pi symporter [Paenibacillus cymbidii]|uniref:Na/Pi symporter n=1 Tax=Paenibacillus cymbidii TaxID=1639034 RepID=UPI001081C727|nr:Na/Pi symporter [Paenibacillus cymbidii]